MKTERIAVLSGVRSPLIKAGTALSDFQADKLGIIAVKEAIHKADLKVGEVDELIMGNVIQPVHAANVARVIAVDAGLDQRTIASTVHRNCASGMESISNAMKQIWLGESKVVVAGGTESMSNAPLIFNRYMTGLFMKLSRAKTFSQKWSAWSKFRPYFLAPIISLEKGLTDPTCGLIMGLTAENLAKDFQISRKEQDLFALDSHLKASKAQKDGVLAEEIVPVLDYKKNKTVEQDNGIRHEQSIEDLTKLRPFFDRKTGTVTVGSSSQITDGAAALTLMSESQAKAEGRDVLGYIKNFAYAGCEPARMGLGPVYATAKLMEKTDFEMKDIDLIELNEAFAAQVIANIKAFASDTFAKEKLNRQYAVGEIDTSKLNVNGGAIALGHPVGMSGTRIVLTLLKELKRRKKQTGLATLCVGGGQGAAFLVESE